MALTTLSNNPMNFTENQHGNAILEKLKLQKEQGRFCDVTLYVEGKQFKAHRNVLASCSPYFDSILKMHRTVKERLTVTCQNSDVFQCLLNYMYTGSVVIDKNNVAELLRLANHFLVSKIKSYCAEYLDRYLDITNCLSVREMAEKYNMPALLKAATLFIQVNLNKVIHQDEIRNCPLPKIEAFLSEKSWTVPQNMLLELIAHWIRHDISSRERSMRALLTFVDWNALDGAKITEHVDREPLYSTSEVSLYFILQSLVENNLLFAKYQGVYQALQEKFSQTGFPLDSDSFLNMAVSTAIEGLQETTSEDSSTTNHHSELTQDLRSEENGKCTPLSGSRNPLKRKRVLSRSRRRYKQKLLGIRPGARLAALKAALATRRNRLNRNKIISDQGGEHGMLLGSVESGVKCHLCSHLARDTTHLEQHLAVAHAKDVTYKCGLCGFMCQWNKDYYSHMRGHFQGPPFKCDSCDFTCDRIHLILTHRMKHSDERPYRCDECGYRCRTRPNLMVHMRCHSGDRPYKCEMCGRAFAMKSTLEQHLASHSSDRPYLCDICGFSTKYLSHLIAHKRIHTGDVYRCSYPQCKYSTPKKSQLGSHARTHAGVRPHSCNICGRGFLEKSHLVRHERIHLEEKPFKCSQCEYASSRRDKLKEHFGRHHGENASAKVPYKARPMRGSSSSSSSGRTGHKTCQDSRSSYNSNNVERTPHQTMAGSGELELMMQHHIPTSSATNNPTTPHQQPPAYPGFPDSHHSSLDFHHHQLLNSRTSSKADHHSVHHHQAPPHHHMLPPARSQHSAAVAAMMFHHANPGGTYHPAPPPASMAAMVAQSGANQNQALSGQHHQGEYPCMPLF
ncbi:zinc finger protein 879 [Anabrus simplex]|uniref:zinc finger protein 879 n=1 Tax=Anabrus simplex TaxID=316456 RepID=UPI0035A2C10B